MKNKKEFKYYFCIAVFVSLYWLVTSQMAEVPSLSTRITTSTAITAAVTFWMQLRRSENLNEANFIMNLNNQFISNKEMTYIEHKLELYYNASLETSDISSIELKLDLNRESEDCQKLINYLVYMESLSAIIQREVMHLDVIDDLFAYRFFIAVNNPIVQKNELLPYANYYQGCFTLSKMWTKKWRKAHRPIPLGDHALYQCKKSLMNKPLVKEKTS